MKNTKRSLKFFMIVLAMLLVVGFAGIVTNVYLDGKLVLSTNVEDFKVYFSAASSPSGSVVLSEDKKSFTFTYGPPCTVTSGNGTAIGNEITCGSEVFVIYNIGETEVKVISKYSLNEGGSLNTSTNAYTAYANPTGLQNTGYESGIIAGVTSFSDEGPTYSGSIVERYVNSYGRKLKTAGIKYNKISLLTKEDLDTLFGSTVAVGTLPNTTYSSWLTNTNFWLKDAETGNNVYVLKNDNSLGISAYNTSPANASVRPALVLPKSVIQYPGGSTTSVVTYTITNDSKQYDANAVVKCGDNNEAEKDSGSVPAKRKVKDEIIVPNSITCQIDLTAAERTTPGEETATEQASNIEFEPEDENWDVSTIKEALDYLRNRSKTGN